MIRDIPVLSGIPGAKLHKYRVSRVHCTDLVLFVQSLPKGGKGNSNFEFNGHARASVGWQLKATVAAVVRGHVFCPSRAHASITLPFFGEYRFSRQPVSFPVRITSIEESGGSWRSSLPERSRSSKGMSAWFGGRVAGYDKHSTIRLRFQSALTASAPFRKMPSGVA